MWFPVRVRGASMEPVLRDGDLLAVRPLRGDEPKPGQIVVARDGAREIVKRVVAIGAQDVALAGDNAGISADPVPLGRDQIAGVVLARYWPIWRIRRFASHGSQA